MNAPVVVGVDGSPGSVAALHWALEHAGRVGAEVEAVSVWTPLPAYAFAAAWVPVAAIDDDPAAAAESELLDVLVAVAREHGRSVPVRPRVVRGRPVEELLRAARSASLLVLGGPALGKAAGLLLGSVSHECVQRATCPVLIVPAADEPRAELSSADEELFTSERKAGPDSLDPGSPRQ